MAARKTAKPANVAETLAVTTKDQVQQASKAAFKSYEDLTSVNKNAFEAVVKSGTIFAKGYEAIGKEVMAYTQSTVEANVAATKALMGARDLREAMDLQTAYTRHSMDKAMAESAKLGEMSMSLAKEAMEPIQVQMNVAMGNVMKPLAA